MIDEILNEESFDKEGLEELLADGVDIDGVLVSNLDGFLREFKKYRGENVAQLIDQANDETKEYTNLLEACANSGPTSHVLPRDLGRRPVRASFCTGAVNSVSFQDPNATIVFFEEID